ncbi:hypothetical protein [Cohaesibacter haloalkalitolerans]|uniref:hypothetical protein n=1 Tax=Cohaesibacter haloalkalitolerans TaxID=1162980 RepID=UPI000E65B5BB|nr:hypothetical protein [Cohaesibacter haloalkalitolerans]
MKRSCLTLGILLVSTAVVQAQSEAEKTWDAIMKDLNQSGLLTVTAGSVHYNEASDSLTVQNLLYKTAFSLPMPKKTMASKAGDGASKDSMSKSGDSNGDSDLKISAEVTIPTAVYTGLQMQEQGWAYDTLTIDTLSGAMDFDSPGTADDTRIELQSLGKSTMTAAYSPFLGEFKIAPSRPIGSVLDYVRPLLLQSGYDETTLDGMVIKQYMAGSQDPIQTTETGPMSVSDVHNGRIGSYEVANQKTDMIIDDKGSLPAKADQAANQTEDQPVHITYSIDKTRYDGYDIGALWSAIDPNAPTIEGTRDALKKIEMAGANLTIPNLAEVKIGPAVQSDITVKQPATYLVPLLDKMIAQDINPDDLSEEDQKALMTAGFDLLRSFSLGLSELGRTDVQIKIPDGPYVGQNAQFSFDTIRQAGVSSYGIKESSISGMTYAGPPSITLKLGRLAIDELEFADYQDIERVMWQSIMEDKEPEGSDVAKLAPNAMTLALSGLDYTDQEGNAVSANGASIRYDRAGLAVPVEISTKIDNLKVSKALIKHPLASVFLDQLGLDALTVNEELSLIWDDESQTYMVNPLNLELPGVAALYGNMGVGGVMRDYLDKPETAQAIMATGTVLPAALTLKDLGGLNELINLAGGAMGMGPDQIRSMAGMQVKAMISGFTEPAFADSVGAEVDRFFNDPKSLKVSLSPSSPVPLAQLLGLAATAPQQIPYILAIGVIANSD